MNEHRIIQALVLQYNAMRECQHSASALAIGCSYREAPPHYLLDSAPDTCFLYTVHTHSFLPPCWITSIIIANSGIALQPHIAFISTFDWLPNAANHKADPPALQVSSRWISSSRFSFVK